MTDTTNTADQSGQKGDTTTNAAGDKGAKGKGKAKTKAVERTDWFIRLEHEIDYDIRFKTIEDTDPEIWNRKRTTYISEE